MATKDGPTTPGWTYFITTNTWEHRAMFENGEWPEIVESRIFEYRDKREYSVHRHVITRDYCLDSLA
jgi:hypothetical protein